MAATIPQKIKLRICHNAKCSFKPVVTSHLKSLNIKKTTKYDAENLGPVSGQAQKCGNVKLNKMIII
jgi:hypothetical protein